MEFDPQKKFDELIGLAQSSPLELIGWLEHGAYKEEVLRKLDSKNNNLLVHALMIDMPSIHELFLGFIKQYPYLLTQENTDGSNAITFAAGKGRKSFLESLKNLGIDINIQTSFGYTALMVASSSGHIEVVKFLLDNLADPNSQDQNGNSALIKAVYNNHVHIVELLLNNNAAVNIQNKDGYTGLAWAAKKGFVEIASRLLNSNADFNIKDNHDKTPLMLAAEYGYYGILSKLITFVKKQNGDVDNKDKHGATSLMWAAYNGHNECVLTLLEAGANPNNADQDGNTALLWAAYNNHTETLKKLAEYKADVNHKNHIGNNAIFWAAKKNFGDIVLTLLQIGVNINDKDSSGKNIFEIASKNKDVLEKAGRYLVTADIANKKLDIKLIKLRSKLLRIELMRLIKNIKELAEFYTDEDEFRERIHTQIKENIFANAEQPEFKEKINQAIEGLYSDLVTKEIRKETEKQGFIEKFTSAIGSFFQSFSFILQGTYRNKAINDVAKDIKIMVIVNVYKDITAAFASAVSLTDQSATQSILPYQNKKKSRSR
ncbi:MAG: ankyrin repeat domain-containing protein [Alphaproteobacteria bacterium]